MGKTSKASGRQVMYKIIHVSIHQEQWENENF